MRLLLAESSAVVLALAYCVGGVVDYNGSYVATTSTTSRRVTPVAACSAVASSWAAQTAATPIPTVNAGLAYECINSAPLKKDAALKFIDELKPYLEWQSGLAFLQNPPADYFFPPHNVFAALDGIRAGLEADEYGNEYAWQQDMFVKVFGPAHDGHLHVYPDILTNAMEWARPFALVSISEDGSSAPVIKIYDDVVSSPDTASVLSFINGIDVATFIEDWAFKVTGSRDPDSAYSSMFYSKAVAVSGGTGHFKQGGRIRFIYPGTVTSFTFENGSFLELPNVARLKGDWSGVVDGPTFFNRFAPGAAEGVADAATIAARSSAKPSSTPTPASLTGPTGINGYPAPLAINGNAAVSGYFIDESGFDDVAVLALRSFGSKHPGEFQKAVEEFFTTAVRAGKTKLVVDLQVNGGGYILQGYDTFRQIFPDIVQESTGQWRYSPGFTAISEVFSKNCEGYDADTASDTLILQCESAYNWRYGLDRNLKAFNSYEAKFPPFVYRDDNYTNLMQPNFANPIDTINSTYGLGFDVTGYGTRKNLNLSRPFGGPENIVLLYDGSCGSTCALFSQSMKWDAGVKSIAMGGRPEVRGKIQGVGGVKGSQMYSFGSVYGFTQMAKRATNDSGLIAQLDRFTPYIMSRASATGVNVKDQILRQDWNDGTPAQFVAEYSDCRLYWRADMHRDITNLWKAAATAAFKGGECAYGAIDYTNTTAPSSKRRVDARPAPLFQSRSPLSPSWGLLREPMVEWDLKSWIFEANHYMATED